MPTALRSSVLTAARSGRVLRSVADWCFLLCRTEIEAAKHAGISVLLVPMSSPGIGVQPIVNAARNREFAESPSTTSTSRRTICLASGVRAGRSQPNYSPTSAVPATLTGSADCPATAATRKRRPPRLAAGHARGPCPAGTGLRRTARATDQSATVFQRAATWKTPGPRGFGRQAADGPCRPGLRTHHDGPMC